MAHDSPLERKRARRGLGARSPEGDTTPAKPHGRMTGAPGGSRNTQAAGEKAETRGRARIARGGQARRRTVQDNPGGER